MPIGCVLFDLDGVIRHFDGAARRKIERRHGLAEDALLIGVTDPDLIGRLVTGGLTRAAWAAAVGRVVGSPEASSEWITDIGQPDRAVIDVVDELRANGYTAAILTNGTDTIPAELSQLGIDRRVDAIFNSAEIGIAKPDPAVFAHVCHELGVSPAAVFFVDDSARNVAAAAGVGMKAVLFTGVDDLRASLAEAGVNVGTG